MRYFYTDPLSAAWMAKQFGMKLLAGNYLIALESVDHFLWLKCIGSMPLSGTASYVIHPDSLVLLDPKIGDLLYSRIGGGVSVEEMLSDERATQIGPHIVQRGGRIIRRNGIPFHWPEVDHG